MALPDYQSLMLPLLRYAGVADGEITTNQAVEVLAQELRAPLFIQNMRTKHKNSIALPSTFLY